eukprot:scaffold114797_cov51-Attheya_sp.AAC.9
MPSSVAEPSWRLATQITGPPKRAVGGFWEPPRSVISPRMVAVAAATLPLISDAFSLIPTRTLSSTRGWKRLGSFIMDSSSIPGCDGGVIGDPEEPLPLMRVKAGGCKRQKTSSSPTHAKSITLKPVSTAGE